MVRHLLNFAAVLSLLLCVVTMALWARAQSVADEVMLKWGDTTLQLITESDRVFLRQWLPDGESGAEAGLFHNVGRQYVARRHQFPSGTPLLRRLGFDAYGFDRPVLFGSAPARAVYFPFWFLMLPGVVLPMLWLRAVGRRQRRRRLATPDLCLSCGYDVRASPERCPECGTFNPSPRFPGETPSRV